MIQKLFLLSAFLLTVSKVFAGKMDLVMISQDEYPETMCTDGSPTGFYFQKGWGEGENKFILYFEGGAACMARTVNNMLLQCVLRAKTFLGTSKVWRQERPGEGILQDSEENNPRFYNWNKVYLTYCDGILHQGYSKEPHRYLFNKIWFRGLPNTQAVFDILVKKYGMGEKQTTDVLLTGSSAGGIAVYTYADYVKSLLHEDTKYWAASDSGFFIDDNPENPDNFFKVCLNTMMKVIDRSLIMPQGCPLIYDENQAYKCVLPQNTVQDIKSDVYIIMSQYDTFNVRVFMGQNCIAHRSFQNCDSEQQNQLQDFRKLMNYDVMNILEQKSNANAWLVACVQHTFFRFNKGYNNGMFEVPEHSGNTAQEALYTWMYANPEDRVNHIDQVGWPLNIPCNGYTNEQLLQEEEMVIYG